MSKFVLAHYYNTLFPEENDLTKFSVWEIPGELRIGIGSETHTGPARTPISYSFLFLLSVFVEITSDNDYGLQDRLISTI